MKTAIRLALLSVLFLAGCARNPTLEEASASPKASSGSIMVPGVGPTLPAPVPMADGVAKFDASNSAILFVGTHTGADPNPRTGTFGEFTGTVQLDPESKVLQSIHVEIQTDSLATDIEKLTNHLKSPDFLDVREYPTITFTSTGIAADSKMPDTYQVLGELTLHGVTKEIEFPAQIEVTGGAVLLRSEFVIDRTAFGMEYGAEQVEKDVTLKVTVGQRSAEVKMEQLPSVRMTPEDRFRQHDSNGDGKLAGDELSEQLRTNLAKIDTDRDDAISLEEFKARGRQRQQAGLASAAGEPGDAGVTRRSGDVSANE